MVRFITKNKCYGLVNHLQIWNDFKKKYPNLKISDEMLKDLFFFDIQLNWLETAPVTIQTKIYCSSIEGFYPDRKEVLANNDLTLDNNLKIYPNMMDYCLSSDEEGDDESQNMRAILKFDFPEVDSKDRC